MQQLLVGLALLVQLQTPVAPPVAPPAAAPPAAPAAAPTAVAPAEVVPPVEAPPPEVKKSLLPPKTKPRLLVMDLTDKGAGAEITNAITQSVQGQAIGSHTGETVTSTQIKILLDAQANQQMTGCDTELCMTDIGKLIEADVILGGNVAKVGDDVIITLLTVNPVDGKRLKQEQRKTPLNRDLYFYAAQQLASIILTGKATDARVPVVLAFKDQNGADIAGSIVVDGKATATAASARLDLDPGQHEVVFQADGFNTWKTLLDVQDGSPLQVNATLVPTRVYLWPGAIVTGVIAVGLAATAAVMFDYSLALYDGNDSLGWKAKDAKGVETEYDAANKNTYLSVTPTNSADLCQRELEISFYAGRAGRTGEAGGATNECGVANGPGLATWTAVGAGAFLAVTAALVTTDVVLTAVE